MCWQHKGSYKGCREGGYTGVVRMTGTPGRANQLMNCHYSSALVLVPGHGYSRTQSPPPGHTGLTWYPALIDHHPSRLPINIVFDRNRARRVPAQRSASRQAVHAPIRMFACALSAQAQGTHTHVHAHSGMCRTGAPCCGVYRHVYRHIYKHAHRHVYDQVYGHAHRNTHTVGATLRCV